MQVVYTHASVTKQYNSVPANAVMLCDWESKPWAWQKVMAA